MSVGSRRAILPVAALSIATLPGCGADPCSEGPGFDNLVASAQRWVRVVSLPPAAGLEGTIELAAEVVPVGSEGDAGPAGIETIAIHDSYLDPIGEGLDDENDVFLALLERPRNPDQVLFVVVRGADGSHHFPGVCTSAGEQLVRERLDGGYDSTIDDVIGLTARQRILKLLESGTS